MKNPIAKNSETEVYDGDALAVRRLSGEGKSRYGELLKEREKFSRLALPSKRTQVLISLALGIGLLFILIAIEFLSGETVYSSDRTVAIVMFSVGGPFALVGAAGLILIAVRAKKVYASSDYRFFEEREGRLLAQFREELGVPETSAEADCFGYGYRMKNGKVKYQSPASKNCFVNTAVRLFSDQEAVFVALEDCVLKIPFSASLELVRVEKRKSFYGWNKEEKPNKGVYRQYKIRTNDSGAFFVKPCYALRFFAGGEEFELLFPPYEYETVSRITGKSA